MKLGFIGMGNMAKALAKGFIGSGAIEATQVLAYAPNQEKLKTNALEIGFCPVSSLKELAALADLLIMACKPYQIEGVLKEIAEDIKGKAIVSIAAGWDFAKYETVLPEGVRVQFVMPNTPAMVGEGVLLFEEKNTLTEEERAEVFRLFDSVGVVKELPTHLMEIGSAVCGCAPAFVDMMIEAYGDAAVKYGMKRADAYELISQMVLGSAKLQLQTGIHPGILKDNVCSPGGTTIRGVAALEEAGFRSACIYSVDAIMNR